MKVSDRLTDIAELICAEALTLAWEQIAERHGVPQYGAGRIAPVRGRPDRRRLRQVRRHRARLRLRPRPRLPARLDRRGAAHQRAEGRGQRRVLPAAGAAARARAVPCTRRPGACTRWTRGCGRAARAGCWCRASRASATTSAARRGPGSTRRCCGRGSWPATRRCASASRRCGATYCASPCGAPRCGKTCAACASACGPSCRSRARSQFDLKQDAGGITDIEFLAQYWTLHWAERYPELVTYSDNIRQLESLASADIVPQATVDVLTGAYRGLPAAHAPPVARGGRQRGVRRPSSRTCAPRSPRSGTPPCQGR